MSALPWIILFLPLAAAGIIALFTLRNRPVSAVLSILFLGEAPTMIHLIGGALSLGGMWLSLQASENRPR